MIYIASHVGVRRVKDGIWLGLNMVRLLTFPAPPALKIIINVNEDL